MPIPNSSQSYLYVWGRDRIVGNASYGYPGLYLVRMKFTPPDLFEAPEYFVSLNGSVTTFSPDESAANPVYLGEDEAIVNQTSVAYIDGLGGSAGTWVMIYGGRASYQSLQPFVHQYLPTLTREQSASFQQKVVMRFAPSPDGPWGPPWGVFNPFWEHAGGYCTTMHYDPNLNIQIPEMAWFGCNDPTGADGASRLDVRNTISKELPYEWGAEYAASIIPAFSPIGAVGDTSIYWFMSTWDPYRVILMKTDTHGF